MISHCEPNAQYEEIERPLCYLLRSLTLEIFCILEGSLKDSEKLQWIKYHLLGYHDNWPLY